MLVDPSAFRDRLAREQDRIARACAACGRDPASVSLLPVTKTHPFVAAVYAWEAGLTAVGENRVAEAAEKRAAGPAGLQWELIGHLQSNKARLAVETFDRIQTVDRLKLLRALDRLAAETGRTLPILLQVNAGDDPAKYGVAVEGAPALFDEALGAPHLRVEGLMTIAPLDDDPDVARRCFARLRTLRDQLATRGGVALPVLSMGMSGDLESAIAEGSTQVRVGTNLFGQRLAN